MNPFSKPMFTEGELQQYRVDQHKQNRTNQAVRARKARERRESQLNRAAERISSFVRGYSQQDIESAQRKLAHPNKPGGIVDLSNREYKSTGQYFNVQGGFY